jgi:tRNA threonylcarbamoyladenosine biosynthesis protein TsaB
LADPNLLLAIDTSTEQTGIALFDGECLDEVSWSSCREHTVLLLDEIDHQLARSRTRVSALAAVAVATGPGRFNALRVGMSVAKGLALALDVPIIGIETLRAIAHPWRGQGRPVAAVLDAGRGRVSWGLFDLDRTPHRASARNTSVDEFISSVAMVAPEVCVTGEVTPTLVDMLTGVEWALIPPRAGRLTRAASVAELAWERVQRGDVDDLASLEPVYLHGGSGAAPGAGGQGGER